MMETLNRYTPPLGRLFLSLIFIVSGINKILNFSGTASYVESKGLPMVPVLLAAAIVLELAGGLSLLLGLKARIGTLLLIFFLIPTTLIFHNFWGFEGADRQMQMIHFMKNLAVLGGLFLVLGLGPGPLSVDQRQ